MHAGLVARAARWLRNSRGMSVVLTRGSVCATEQPDALGWNGLGGSILVECKTNRADFFRDAAKPFRRFPTAGVGNLRYYLVPPGLVRPEEVPEGWGLLECLPARIVERKAAPWQSEKGRAEELRLLLAHVRRGGGACEDGVDLEAGCLADWCI